MTDTTDPARIDWHGFAERWTWPFTAEQMGRLSVCPCFVDGVVQVVGIGPDAPDLILALGAETCADNITDLCGEEGASYLVRFGSMQMGSFVNLPEHTGW